MKEEETGAGHNARASALTDIKLFGRWVKLPVEFQKVSLNLGHFPTLGGHLGHLLVLGSDATKGDLKPSWFP